METVEELLEAVKTHFPELSEKTDRMYMQRFEDEKFELTFSWFECLADVLNIEMAAQVPPETHVQFFEYVRRQLAKGNQKIHECVDVSLIENMFFHVKPEYAKPYWKALPQSLKELYLGFHSRPPL
jgi:hypothetical protein